jgi:hypothetical protein
MQKQNLNNSNLNLIYFGDDSVYWHILCELRRLTEENNYLKKCIKEGSEGKKCAVCGKEIVNLSMQRMTRPNLWCSRECFTKKPRKIIALEKDFGKDIVEILKETTRKCGKIKTQCNILGVSIPKFYQMLEKYCEEDLLSFMSKNASGSRKVHYAKKLKQSREEAEN